MSLLICLVCCSFVVVRSFAPIVGKLLFHPSTDAKQYDIQESFYNRRVLQQSLSSLRSMDVASNSSVGPGKTNLCDH